MTTNNQEPATELERLEKLMDDAINANMIAWIGVTHVEEDDFWELIEAAQKALEAQGNYLDAVLAQREVTSD